MQNSVISTWFTSLYGSEPSSVVFAWKTATVGPVYESLWVPDLTGRFVHSKQRDLYQNIKFTWVPALICCFVHAKQRLLDQCTSLYVSQTWTVVLCMYNSGLNIRFTILYGSQPSSVVFACKTAWLVSESLVSMGSSPHLWFWAHITACLAQV